MTEDSFYIGIVKERFPSNPVDRIIVYPLMELDKQKNIWTNIDTIRCLQLFPDKGLIVSFIDNPNLLENQVIYFKIYENSKYIRGDSKRHAKFSIDKNHFHVLLELLTLNFQGSESDLREAIISGNLHYDQPHNSECLIALSENRWLGPLKFQLNNPSHCIVPVDPNLWHNLQIHQIDEHSRIIPKHLGNRFFVDPNQSFGKLLDLRNWQTEPIFISCLIKRLNEHLKEPQSFSKVSSGFHDLKKLVEQPKEDKALLHRLQELETMNGLQQKDIDAITKILSAMKPFHNELERIKKETIAKTQAEVKIKAEEEIYLRRQEKTELENQIAELKHKAAKLEQFLEKQNTCMGQTLDKFERSLAEHLDRFAVEPTSILAEALANDAFLQLILGKNRRQLKLAPSTTLLLPINTPNFEINHGPFFNTAEVLLNKYRSRLDLVDLNESLAIWTTAITLSGLIPVFKGNALRRALTVFTNHLAYGRCFELPLSPEIISIERLFTIGQSGDASSLGILDTAIIHAANHREALFILVLEGLDRAPSQYFMDTLLGWYERGLLDMPSDALLFRHLERLRVQHGLADEILGWPPNLLLTATVNGIADGFSLSSTALRQIVEVIVESQGEYLDTRPALLDQNARKPAGEVAASCWNHWRDKAQEQDIGPMAQSIASCSQTEKPDPVLQDTALRVFAALCTLGEPQENAMKIVYWYLLKNPKTGAVHG